MIAAVLGATGFVGSAVTDELTKQGHTVLKVQAPRLVSTAESVGELLADSYSMRAEIKALAESVATADVVINAAGLATPGGPDSPELTGANALLPVLVARAITATPVQRFVHLSSAAVQGQRTVLDESTATTPFSAYSRSKALGEQALTALASNTVILRATSVQGQNRPTTAALVRIASSPLSSVATPGTAPTPVSSISSLADFAVHVATVEQQPPAVVLQPWEETTVRSVLRAAGGRDPLELPVGLCRLVLRTGYAMSTLLGERLHGPIRRVELMWFGQRQEALWAVHSGFVVRPCVELTLEGARSSR